MPRKKKPQLTEEEKVQRALENLKEIPGFPADLYERTEHLMLNASNAKAVRVTVYAIAGDYYWKKKAYNSKPDKLLARTVVQLENLHTLNCPELEIGLSNLTDTLAPMGLAVGNTKSARDLDAKNLQDVKNYIRAISIWRANGGNQYWRADSKRVLWIVQEYSERMDEVMAALRTVESLDGPFVAAMDEVTQPLMDGAL